MAYKDILVHMDEGKAAQARLALAADLAEALEAHLTALYLAPNPYLPGNLRAELPDSFFTTLDRQIEEGLAAARERLEATLKKRGIGSEVRTAHYEPTRFAHAICRHARYADLVVLGQADPEHAGQLEQELPEDVLLGSGRPALLEPHVGARKTPGERVLIAWDGSRESVRAVNDAMPLLERAKWAGVLVVNPSRGDHGDQPGADIARYLARHGIAVEAEHTEARDITVADAILGRVADEGADLLVMGAYGHARLRETVLGGTTRQILREMTVPVLMSH